ncbi:hypothetical protein B0I35DRAFT_232757 [Stachybotrys elegans]|uniref:Uncharacterized protein n=1 Tax=Stachybotrys elegans TaxID=80388 RepID=A0A8K0STB1_9HYPO|nr:hypothetical protein B0I35DRAFT_232757 [Stachybotrys elegans]
MARGEARTLALVVAMIRDGHATCCLQNIGESHLPTRTDGMAVLSCRVMEDSEMYQLITAAQSLISFVPAPANVHDIGQCNC